MDANIDRNVAQRPDGRRLDWGRLGIVVWFLNLPLTLVLVIFAPFPDMPGWLFIVPLVLFAAPMVAAMLGYLGYEVYRFVFPTNEERERDERSMY